MNFEAFGGNLAEIWFLNVSEKEVAYVYHRYWWKFFLVYGPNFFIEMIHPIAAISYGDKAA